MSPSKQLLIQRLKLMVFIFLLCLYLCLGLNDHRHCSHHHDNHDYKMAQAKLPEELAEEEDLKLYGFDSQHDYHYGLVGGHNYDHGHASWLHHDGGSDLPKLALWVHALGCAFLVSMASLICLILLPIIFVQGRPSKVVVDSLALFGAGAMLGDAFLHQLPHAFGGEHSHSHDHFVNHSHESHSGHGHSHTLKDLSVGISVLAGIVLFLIVEKLVRYVEDHSQVSDAWNHGHHHIKSNKKLDDAKNAEDNDQSKSSDGNKISSEMLSHDSLEGKNLGSLCSLVRKTISYGAFLTCFPQRRVKDGAADTVTDEVANNGESKNLICTKNEELSPASSNLVFGYLNLFSDGVHNFTDRMALGSAFLLYGSVCGWSRTLFLLAHEIPQESLLWGRDPGQSSLIEGFTAGGFIYIAVAGVLAEMNSNGSWSVKSSLAQLTSLVLGMAVALCISLVG
ncbi:hypothetical protein SAY87_015586 [Trapa incisa]|uniref:IAA-alanine resistance protein 1 n=1 Tax=Trapa incisa TaxID=236973 RepID=A0AAN7QXB3_9MYRT|nr:hypothetical protein SAY87_015586 [Trapa incisa]